MNINKLVRKIATLIRGNIIIGLFSELRILKYKFLSDCKRVSGRPNYNSPVLISGSGIVEFGNNVSLGVRKSPFFFNTYLHIEARSTSSTISIGDNVWINNNSTLISDGSSITIHDNVLIGYNFSMYDSDFHDLHPEKRLTGNPQIASVTIKRNVFIGSNVTILKGVEIGENSIIASGSIVTKSIRANVIAGGNPCKVIREIIF
jgi:acetyltransferase-like isoleucine patch superfamily enzyme